MMSEIRGPEYLHVLVHVKDTPKVDESPDSEVIEFIDRYITCAILDRFLFSVVQIGNCSTESQTHSHVVRKKVLCVDLVHLGLHLKPLK